jgi:hypothetical protein
MIEIVTPVEHASYVLCKENNSVLDYVFKKVGYKSKKAKSYKTSFYSFDGKLLKEITEEIIGSECNNTVCRNPIQYLDPNAPNPQPTTYRFISYWVFKSRQFRPPTGIFFYDKHENEIAAFRYSEHQKAINEYATWGDWVKKEFGHSKNEYKVATNKNLDLSIVKGDTKTSLRLNLGLATGSFFISLSEWMMPHLFKELPKKEVGK